MLRELDVQCLVYAGNADDRAHASAEQSVEDTRNTSCVSVPGSDHLQGMSRIDVVLPPCQKALARIQPRELRRPLSHRVTCLEKISLIWEIQG